MGQFETEGVEGEDGKFLGTVADSVLGHQGFGSVIEFVVFDFVFGESGPEANVDHDVPGGEIEALHHCPYQYSINITPTYTQHLYQSYITIISQTHLFDPSIDSYL